MKEQMDAAILEKRKHVRLTSLCNNNCSFCLAGHVKEKFMFGLDDLRQDLIDGIREGNSRLILSGGEASINRNIIEIISFAKKLGYKKIQLITNGRMLSNKQFVLQLRSAGLDEATFSIHSHLPHVHDELTCVPGSFKHAVSGLINAIRCGLIVNVDIVLNSMNVKTLRETILFFNKLGVGEFDLLQITPFGNALDNMQTLFYDIDANIEHLRRAFDLGKERRIVIWTNRFPAEYLEGYESLIQDSHKILDEVNGRKKMFNELIKTGKMLQCRDHRCSVCYMNQFCTKLIDAVSLGQISIPQKKIFIDKRNVDSVEKEEKAAFSDSIISMTPPIGMPSDYSIVAINPSRIQDFFKNLGTQIVKTDLPPCLSGSSTDYFQRQWHRDSSLFQSGKLNLDRFSEEFVKNYKIKAQKCRQCKHNCLCEGIYQNYIKIYGFAVLNAVRD